MSIRLRLTLLYTVILALTLAGMAGVLYGTQLRSMRAEETQLLAGWARRAVEHLQSDDPGFGGPFGDRPLFLPPPPEGEMPERRFGAPATYAQLTSADGQLILRSENLGEVSLPLSAAGLRAVQRGNTWVEAASVESERLLIYSAPVIAGGEVTGAVQVAHSLAAQDAYLSTMRGNLLVGSGIAVIVAFGCGWLLSGVVLRPIHRITRTARTIGTDRDLSQRVDYHGPNDELGQLTTTFNAMLSELETAHRQQQQFVADVSHELRTPLTTLNGNIELLRRQPPISESDRSEVLSDMTEESKRLIRLVNALLTLARADARQPLKHELTEVRPLIEDVCRQTSLLAPDRPITSSKVTDAVVSGDPDALRQVVLILVDNALKYTSGPIAVSASHVEGAGQQASDEGNVAIEIGDSGPGIDPALLPHIFERFYRGDAVRDRPGFGLGLSIAKALVEAQNGTISIESDPERGSVVTVTMPCVVAPGEGS